MCLVAFEKVDTNRKRLRRYDSPVWAYLAITGECDLSCAWCYARNSGSRARYDRAGLAVVLDKCRQLGVFQVSFSGGEPTTHPDLIEFIASSNKLGFSTNLITHGRRGALAGVITALRSGKVRLHQLQLNWNYSSFRELADPVSELKGLTNLAVTIVGSRENLDHLDELLDAAVSHGVNKIRIWDECGLAYRKDNLPIRDYFERVKPALLPRGYTVLESYDPEITETEISIPCLLKSGAVLFVDNQYQVVSCLAEARPELIADLRQDSVPELLRQYRAAVAAMPPGVCYARR